MTHLVSADGSWSVLDRASPNTRVLVERNGERHNASDWQPYKSFCKDLSRAGSVAAIRLLRAALGVSEGDRYLDADEEAADGYAQTRDLMLLIQISFRLRAGWLDLLEEETSDWLEYEKGCELRQRAERGKDAIDRLRKLFRLAHRGRRGPGFVLRDDW